MIWLRFIWRTIKNSRLKSLCVMAAVIIVALTVVALTTTSKILSGTAREASQSTLLIASRAAPLIDSLPYGAMRTIRTAAPNLPIVPLSIAAVSAGTDTLPAALLGTDIAQYAEINDLTVNKDANDPIMVAVGRQYALSHGVGPGDVLPVRFTKSFLPLKTDRLSLRIDAIFIDETGRTNERQILIDRERLDAQALLLPGRVSAFLVKTDNRQTTRATATAIDAAFRNSATPVISGDQSVITASLIQRFVDIQQAVITIGVLAAIVNLVVLIVASREMLLRDQKAMQWLLRLGYSSRQCWKLLAGRWALLTSEGLLLGTVQLSIAWALYAGRAIDISPDLLPSKETLLLAAASALTLSALAFVISSFGVSYTAYREKG